MRVACRDDEEQTLLLRLEQIRKMKKINQLQNDKNDLLEKVQNLTTLIRSIDDQIAELIHF